MKPENIWVSLFGLLSLYLAGCASNAVTVDVGRVIADTAHHPVGIDLHYLLDDDALRTPTRSLTEALRDMGVRYLRYPGGDACYLWSVPPFDKPLPTLGRTGPHEWAANDLRFTLPDQKTLRETLDFDEFMAIAHALKAEPVITICSDSMYKPATADGTAPTRQQLLDTAVAWVRYANITKGYHVRYWEIGNESWLDGYHDSLETTASDYAKDVVEFSAAMKAVDPTIQIGANGHTDSWWKTVLPVAARSIDFLIEHAYPIWAWQSYDHYRRQTTDFLVDVRDAQEALHSYVPLSERARLQIAITEFNAIDYAPTDTWPNVNDLGHALVVFDMMGQQLSQPGILSVHLWCTRWVNNQPTGPPPVYDALDQFNQYTPVGRAVAIWGQLLGDQLVAVTAPEPIFGYASYTPASRRLAVLLLNKDTVERSLALTLHNYHAGPWAQSWVFTGSGPADTRPTWTQRPDIRVEETPVTATLAPLSVTAVLFEGPVDDRSLAKPEHRLVIP